MLVQSETAVGRYLTLPIEMADGDRPIELVPVITLIAKQSRALLGILLDEIDIHPGQDQLLLALSPDTSMTVCDLATALSVRASTVSKMLDRLVDRDLVSRSADRRDARKTQVAITEKGMNAQKEIRDIYARLEGELARSLGGDLDGILQCLVRLEQTMSVRLLRLR